MRADDQRPSHARAAADERRRVGRRGETLAAAHLRGLGFALLARNVRSRRGEIDLIAFDGQTLVFVEVKCRRVRATGRGASPDQNPLAALGGRQRSRVRALAAAWLAERGRAHPFAQTLRFDAIGMTVDRGGRLVHLEHIPGAW
jgi:putative endonuclease